MKNFATNISNVKIWALLRISLGWIFFWAFLDKLLGLGFTTCRQGDVIVRFCESAWIKGGSPIYGYLTFSSKGIFSSAYQALASSDIVAWLFMLGLFSIGISLLFGIFKTSLSDRTTKFFTSFCNPFHFYKSFFGRSKKFYIKY